MIHLCYSNRTEALLDRFAGDLAKWRAGAGLFEPATLVVPNRNVELWLKRQVAARDGIAANFQVLFLRRFVAGLVERHDPGLRVVDSELMQDLLLTALFDEERLALPGLAPVRGYLFGAGSETDAVDLRRVQLARQLARLFEEYLFSRPDMIAAWPERPVLRDGRWAETEAWQRALWIEIFGPGGLLARRAEASGARFKTLPQILAELPANALAGGAPVFLFGVSYVATLFQQVLARIAGAGELFVYTLNPCMEFWEDLHTHKELARAKRKLPRRGQRLDPRELIESEDPFQLKAAGDTPALALWGRPGRENVRLLDQLSQCDFHEAFADPLAEGGPTLLARLQHDILVREPEPVPGSGSSGFASDRSVRLLACPGARREAEAIAQEIWALVEEDDARKGANPLRFSDIGVMVAGGAPETYFTHLASVFEERGFEIPYTLEASALATQSRIAEAAQLLLELPFGRFTRAEVLRVATHPSVAARFPEVDTSEWVRWTDALGIFHGADRSDHEGSYLDRDLHNWDQGLRRLALGAVMTGEKSGDAREFALDAEGYRPEEHTESAEGSASAFGRLVRSLLTDVRFLRASRLTMADWGELLGRMLATYLVPAGDHERGDLDRCLSAVRALGDLELDGEQVSYRVAGELAKDALGALTRSSGRGADEGVSVSTLQPMRALPFKVIFVAGLGEGRFPSADRKSELDLRGARPRAGDVSAREQDQYMFLETLLCARERLYLSYVARDELTGDRLQPSPVVGELLRMIDRGYLSGAAEALIREVPLRRFDEDALKDRPAPAEAHAEARMLAWRASLPPSVGARALDRARLRRLSGDLEAELRLPKIAVAPRRLGEAGSLRVRLAELRRFLECPLQGVARYLLRLEEDEEDRSLIEDEPFDGQRLLQLVGQRQIFLDFLRDRGGRPLEAIAEAWAAPHIAAGALPAGFLWGLEKGALVEGPEVWQKLLEGADPGLPGIRVHGFGPAAERARVDEKHDPIVLTLDGVEGAAGPLVAEIVGTTGPLLEDGASELALHQRRAHAKDLEEARRRHDSLGAFLDHLALSAAGLHDHGFASHQLYDYRDESRAKAYLFAPVPRERAREYLATLVRDLLVVREHLFPAVAVFDWRAAVAKFERGETGWRKGFADSVDDVQERGHFASQYGPVRDAESYPAPADDEAEELFRRRFGLYFEIASEPDAAAEGAR